MSFFLGGSEEGSAKPRGRAMRQAGNGSSFSLGWGADSDDMKVSSPRAGKRAGGPTSMPSQAAYAIALKEQIAVRDAHRAADRWSVQPQPSIPSLPPRSAASGYAGHVREATPFARLGGAVVDSKSQAALAHAEELRAQISANKEGKAEERRLRLAAEREENARLLNSEAPVQSEPYQRHRLMEERADALERFISNNGQALAQPGGVKPRDPPAGMKPAAAQQGRIRPPRPEPSINLGW